MGVVIVITRDIHNIIWESSWYPGEMSIYGSPWSMISILIHVETGVTMTACVVTDYKVLHVQL